MSGKWIGGKNINGIIPPTKRNALTSCVPPVNTSQDAACSIATRPYGVAGRSLDPKRTFSRGKITQSDFFDRSDTGYRSVADGQDEESVPQCPAFKQIGQKYGPIDLASYNPLNGVLMGVSRLGHILQDI